MSDKGRLLGYGRLSAPLNTLSARSRVFVVAAFTSLTLGWCTWRNSRFHDAWTLPDVKFYFLMARGRYDLVPAPFSARPLAPVLARVLASVLHGSVEKGFALLATVCLVFTMATVFWLSTRTSAPRWCLVLLATISFWPQLLGDAGLPDPLYTGLLAALLLALQAEAFNDAAALMIPLMMTRESPWLTLLCLGGIGWRRLRWPDVLLALASAAAGALLVHHLSAGSLPNPEHLPGTLYLAGKLVSNTARSVGIAPWSNGSPEICTVPTCQHTLHLGPVRSVGVCEFAAEDPLEVLSAVLTVFGVLPALAVVLLWARRRISLSSLTLVTRFSLFYGGISFLIAPSLGTWYTRLFGYGWPLFLVALPQLLGALPNLSNAGHSPHRASTTWSSLVVLHLGIFTLGQQPIPRGVIALIAVLELAWVALFTVQQRSVSRTGSLPDSAAPRGKIT